MLLWTEKKRIKLVSVVTAVLMLAQLVLGAAAGSAWAIAAAEDYTEQPGAASRWVVTGSFQNWNPNAEETRMKHLVGGFYAYSRELPAGTHEFKIVRNGNWNDGAIITNKGNNISFNLTEPTRVHFYVNEELGEGRISLPGVEGLQQYVPALDAAQLPRLVGSLQSAFGENEWAPDQAGQFFVDYYFNNTVYKLQRTLPAGSYEAKVVFGANWDAPNYGAEDGSNTKLVTLDRADVTFSIDMAAEKKALTHDYTAKDGSFDGQIKKDAIVFDSRSVTYKKPFGAIPAGSQDLTLRIAAERDDVQTAKAELTGPDGLSNAYEMKKVTSVDTKDYWEVTIGAAETAGKVGIWGYKFILVDGVTKVEYGDDSTRGGTGAPADEGALPFDLTVYKPDFQTPDWIKNAVVYQIFPDRFFDGSKANNRAKLLDGARGALSPEYATEKNGQQLQYFDGGIENEPAPDQVWGDAAVVPENPDRVKPENKPYYPDAESDGAWTNEFYGGDIQGIEQKLGYLKSLGITAVYLNPVAWAASNHKYDATDYKHMDPMFGQPVYNEPGNPASGLNYVETRKASDEVFVQFAKAAEAVGIKVINDGVFNHVGDDSIYFDRYSKYPEIGAYEYWAAVFDKMKASGVDQSQAEQEVRASFTAQVNPMTGENYKFPEDFRYVSWFTVTNELVKNRDDDGLHYKYDAWWGYDSLPVMDAKDPQLTETEYLPADTLSLPGQHEWNNIHYRDHVIGHDLTDLSEADAQEQMQFVGSQRWLWMGASGWRLDVAPDVSNGTWSKFRTAVKSAAERTNASGTSIEEPVLIGEEWGVATKFLLGDQFDSVMNYRFRGALQSFLSGGSAETFNQALESIREDYPKEAWSALMNLVGSHDTTRSITKYDHPEWEEEHLIIAPEATDAAIKLQELTAIFQMGYPGAPTIYYGDEVGVAGTKDPDSRRMFPWERVTAQQDGTFTATGNYAGLFSTYQQAAKVRNDNPVFRTGDIKPAYNGDGVIAYARKDAAKGAMLVVNRSDAPQTIEADVAGFLPEGLRLIDELDGTAEGTVVNGKVTLTIPALTGFMMVSEGELQAVPEVQGLTAQGADGEVNLSWTPVAGAESYAVYRAAIEGGDVMLVGSTTETSHKDVNVVNGSKYYYAVTAKIGTGESFLGTMVPATPAYEVNSIFPPASVTQDVYAGVGKKTPNISVTINVYGLTDDPQYAGEEAPGLIARLVYYKEGTDPAAAQDVKLRYENDNGRGKSYWAAFEPTEPGTYHYYAKVSTDNGEHFTLSTEGSVWVQADPEDGTPPAAPQLQSITVESNRVQLNWTASADASVSGYEVYRQSPGNAGFRKIAVLDGAAAAYTDYAVSNDRLYTYRVAAFDAAYNRSYSEDQSVTPKLVMVDVLLRLHLPDYTPTSDDITIAGSMNGWNASATKLNVPSGATDRRVVEYSFKMMAGKSIEYKYTRGHWDTEAFTSHSRTANDTSDHGNWAYSSTDTNMKLTIANQGGNQMVVNDYVLRWKDMPMILTMPRITYGSDVTYSTEDSSFKLKGVVPFGVAFTINGQPLPAEAMDAYGNVELDAIPLQPGLNTYELHIEPTAETMSQPWYTDQGRKDQATKTIKLNITRTSGTTGTGSGGSYSSSAPAAPEAIKTVNEAALKSAKDGTVTVELGAAETGITLPAQAGTILGSNQLELKRGGLVMQVPAALLQQLAQGLSGQEAAGARITLMVNTLETAAGQQLVSHGAAQAGAELTVVSAVYDFDLAMVTTAGKNRKLESFNQPVTVSFDTPAGGDRSLSGVYFLNDNGNVEYVGGVWTDGRLTAELHHFSKYAVLHYNKSFTDLPAGHWASAAVKQLAARQVIDGVSAGEFAPERQVTRAEFAAMAVRALGLAQPSAAPSAFTDVDPDAWYAGAVAAAAAEGIVTGRGEATFAPDAPITREEMAAIIVRAYEVKHGKAGQAANTAFADAEAISPWAVESVQQAAALQLLQGRSEGMFAPAGITTRAESAQVLINLLNAAE